MTAVELLTDIVARGGRIVADAERPRLLVPDTLKPLVEANRNELRSCVKLWALLDTWSGINEVEWSAEAVDTLKNRIMDVFSECPRLAPAWFAAWRRLHPDARLS
jgi:hypothetical protein